MKLVLDASIGLKTVLNEDHSSIAVRLLQEYRAGIHELLAPDIFPMEIGNALTRAERKKIIPEGNAAVLLADVMNPGPLLYPHWSLLSEAIELSSQTHSGVPDLMYLVLAMREGCELVTADEKLINNLQGHPSIIHISQL